MFKISDKLHSSFSNYTNFKCTKIFANETTFAILGTHLWPLSVYVDALATNNIHGTDVCVDPESFVRGGPTLTTYSS